MTEGKKQRRRGAGGGRLGRQLDTLEFDVKCWARAITIDKHAGESTPNKQAANGRTNAECLQGGGECEGGGGREVRGIEKGKLE